MKLAVVLNGISSRKNLFYRKILPQLKSRHIVEVFETAFPNHAFDLSRDLSTKDFDILFAAGGDGTLHQVVNGIMTVSDVQNRPAVGLIPLGSGNDFARSMSITADVNQLLNLLENPSFTEVDLGKIHFITFDGRHDERYFINVADIGMGPEVVQKVSAAPKILGSAIGYYSSIIRTFFSYKPAKVFAKTNDWSWEGKLRSLAVANGKYYGHGLCVAPAAKINDRMLDVFICGDVSVFDFIIQSENLKKGKHLSLEEVKYKTCVDIDLKSEGKCLIEGDGEVLGVLPAIVRLERETIKMLLSDEQK
jgi:diacylglycerol kinase (ATP)